MDVIFWYKTWKSVAIKFGATVDGSKIVDYKLL